METIASFPTTDIFAILPLTVQAFHPLLLANKELIFAIPCQTFRYGPHPRQELDVYEPPGADNGAAPILVFLHGGGLNRGAKDVEYVPDHLVYHNLGTFFARRGFVTIVPNYRRVNDSVAGTGDDAVFPSGGEDVSLVLSWVENIYCKPSPFPRDLFVMGNSAGGIHMMTWLLYDKFAQERRHYTSDSNKCRLRACVNHSAPTYRRGPPFPRRARIFNTYYDQELADPQRKAYEQFSSLGLFKTMLLAHPALKAPKDFHLPPILNVVGELDPNDEILDDFHVFQAEWEKAFPTVRAADEIVDYTHYSGRGLQTHWMAGHNHISPPVALMSGEGEEWAEDMIKWMEMYMSKPSQSI